MQSSIRLSKEALIHNIQEIRKCIGPAKKVIAVVKANAYGHGIREVAPIIQEHIDAFAIDDIQELIELRKLTDKEIYVLGHVCKEDVEELIQNNGLPVIYDVETLVYLNEQARHKTVEVNIKIDAFLGRQGVLLENLPGLLETVEQCKNIRLRGVYSHFSNIEDTTDFSQAQRQIDGLSEAIKIIDSFGHKDYEKHISSTAGILLYEHSATEYTHVRLGIGMYGLWPSQKVRERTGATIDLQPVLTWASCVAQIKTVPEGFPIGYGCTYITDKLTTIALIPQGYSDGYDRKLSNSGNVLIHATRCPVLGRIAMNMFVVDVTGIKGIAVEDEVILIGSQGKEIISADDMAEKIDTISYEVISRIQPKLKREITDRTL